MKYLQYHPYLWAKCLKKQTKQQQNYTEQFEMGSFSIGFSDVCLLLLIEIKVGFSVFG